MLNAKPTYIILFCCLSLPIFCQINPDFSTQDTIYIRNEFIGNFYYLNGRKINTSVMEWLMHEVPEARVKIQNSIKLDRLSVAAYSFGGLFTLSGLSTLNENNSLSPKLIKAGAICFGSGLVFQILHARLKKQAVTLYNAEKLKMPADTRVGWQFDFSKNGFKIVYVF